LFDAVLKTHLIIRMVYPLVRKFHAVSGTLLGLLLLTVSVKVLAHGGHGNEFQSGAASQPVGAIKVDAATAQRLGLKVEPVKRQSFAFGIKTTGQLETLPNQKVEVTTPVTGTIIKLLVSPGVKVSKGQAVAILSSPELAQLRVGSQEKRAEAVADVQKAQANVNLAKQNYDRQQQIAKTELQQARSQLTFSQERFDRDNELANAGALPRRNALESQTQLAEAKAAEAKAASRLQFLEADAQLRRSYADLQVAQSRIQLSSSTYQARLKQLGANPNPDGTITITAPIAGTVADREATLGESGQDAGKRIMTILGDRTILLSANIYEKDLDKVQVGQRVNIKVASLPKRTFIGSVSLIGSAVEGETRVVPVKAELDNAEGLLKPGMFAELEVLTNRTPVAVLAVPKSAVVETNDKKQVVFVQNGVAYQPVEVTVGRTFGAFVEVKSGLFDGDRIVTQRANQLYAQSLRGDTKAKDEHAESAVRNGSLPLPLWTLLTIGGVIAASTFWAGMAVAGRRRQTGAMLQPVEVSGYKAEEHLEQPALILQSAQRPEEHFDSHQSQ
jgi:membrane fusion protein, heavy metal efflux system